MEDGAAEEVMEVPGKQGACSHLCVLVPDLGEVTSAWSRPPVEVRAVPFVLRGKCAHVTCPGLQGPGAWVWQSWSSDSDRL